MDFGRPAEARFSNSSVRMDGVEVTREEIEEVVANVSPFGDDNRAGIERTLHRISAMRNRTGDTVGLTCRVGRSVRGGVRLIEDLVKSGNSTLILGRPGIGKTTMLREVARVLADQENRRVVIVDTSNEIAGDGDTPHPAIGNSRRMQVPSTALQHQVMIEAVENHMPEVIVIDEMSTELEALAARTIAERGVQLVATAHGNTLENVISNPTLADLVGGVHSVTLGDIEARRRRSQKTVLERKHEPTFGTVVEIRGRNYVSVHEEVGEAVDKILLGKTFRVEARRLTETGDVHVELEMHTTQLTGHRRTYSVRYPIEQAEKYQEQEKGNFIPHQTHVRVYPFGLPAHLLQTLATEQGAPISVVKNPESAEVFVTTKSDYNRRPHSVRSAEKEGWPVYVIRKATTDQISKFISKFAEQRSSERLTLHNIHVNSAVDNQESNETANGLSSTHEKVDSPPSHLAFVKDLRFRLESKYASSRQHKGKTYSRQSRW